jgi:5-aminolevulinate synthase
MESLLNQSRAMCPFLKRASPTALRSLSTATRPSSSPGGGTISNLQVIARRCPVMSKALAVQSSRLASKRFTTAAGVGMGVPIAKDRKALNETPRCPRALHTTAGNGASVEIGAYEKNDRGKSSQRRQVCPWSIMPRNRTTILDCYELYSIVSEEYP